MNLIRWVQQSDLSEILEIEKSNFRRPWEKADFIWHLRQGKCIGVLADYDNKIIGYMIYLPKKLDFEILNLAVDISYQRKGVATAFLRKLMSKLSSKRKKISLEICETNLAAQIFFRNRGFKATEVVHRYSEIDTYLFEKNYELCPSCGCP